MNLMRSFLLNVAEDVKPLQPVSYNWSDPDQPKEHQNEHRRRYVDLGSRHGLGYMWLHECLKITVVKRI